MLTSHSALPSMHLPFALGLLPLPDMYCRQVWGLMRYLMAAPAASTANSARSQKTSAEEVLRVCAYLLRECITQQEHIGLQVLRLVSLCRLGSHAD